MRNRYSGLSTLIALALGVGGCTSSTGEAEQPAPRDSLVRCVEPRPQICTREYRPVCAKLADGSTKTYATGCTACADSAVIGHGPGACE